MATISYQGTTSVVPGATFPPVGFSRCRLKNQGLKALGHRPLRSARLKAPEGVPWSFYISDGCRFGVGT